MNSPATATTQNLVDPSMVTFLISTLLIIVSLVVILYLVRKFNSGQSGSSRYMRVVDSMPLGRSAAVYLLKLKEEYVFLAVTQNSAEVIERITDPDQVKDIDVDQGGSHFSKILFSKVGKNFLKGQIDRIDRIE